MNSFRSWQPSNILRIGVAVVSLSLVALSAASPVRAEQKPWGITLGVGLGAAPDYEGSKDYEAVPFFIARAHWHELFIRLEGTTLRANLVPHAVFRAGPVFRLRAERDDVENDAVDALRAIDTAYEVGGFVGIEIGPWRTNIDVVQDVADAHKGLLVTLRTELFLPLNEALFVELKVSSTHANDDFMTTYFSIDADNAVRSGLTSFDADAGFKDVSFGLSVTQALSRHWSLTATVTYSRLLGDAADSPIVKDEGSVNQFFGGALIGLTF